MWGECANHPPSLREPLECFISFLNFLDFIHLFLERGEGREKEGEKHQGVVASCAPPTGDLARNPGMCPDWELNWQPFSSQASAQSTEPHQGSHWRVLSGEVHPILGLPDKTQDAQ